MHIQPHSPHPVSWIFKELPLKKQTKILELMERVNKLYLHCEDQVIWNRVHMMMTEMLSIHYLKKMTKKRDRNLLVQNHLMNQANQQDIRKNLTKRIDTQSKSVSGEGYAILIEHVRQKLRETFHDSLFTDHIVDAFQHHLMNPLKNNHELVQALSVWIIINTTYLPLGAHLLNAYKKDMAGESNFSKYVMPFHQLERYPEALSEKVIMHMTAFLSEAGQAHSRAFGEVSLTNQERTAAIISVKNGAGGHTAPAQAIEKRLIDQGWKVKTIHFDEDFGEEFDAWRSLGITFEDGTPMTHHLFCTRWLMQKHNRKESLVIGKYVRSRSALDPLLFFDDEGGHLLRNMIKPLNPQLIIATCAYHWTWKALACRVSGAKTLLIATDVFFHFTGLNAWYRQQDLPEELRKIHFTSMSDDLQLMKSMADHHDEYHRAKYAKKYPGLPIESWMPIFSGLELDSQISVIGAPVHPSFKAITDPQEIERLRNKWKVSKGAMSVCISRGKLGYDSDLAPALERYRTKESLPMPLEIQVVCGENHLFYQKILNGAYKDLGPNITVVAHPLRQPQDFAEIRAISTLDDIKAGGGSTFEGQYLIAQGSKTQLLLTPGPKLWWEKSNCEAMEKWGVGFMVSEKTPIIEIVKKVMKEGIPTSAKPYLDWKPLFDKCVNQLVSPIAKT